MKTVGLFFGSFNPIHIGHIMTANYCVEHYELDELWFVIAAHNPLKNKANIIPFEQRMEMIHLAINDNPKMKVNDIELSLSEPFYTIKTIQALKEKYVNDNIQFILIIGIDNWLTINKWNSYEELLKERIIVLPRGNNDDLTAFIKKKNKLQDIHYDMRMEIFNNVRFATQCPACNMSSTFIRNEFHNNKSVYSYLPNNVINYIKQNNLYV